MEALQKKSLLLMVLILTNLFFNHASIFAQKTEKEVIESNKTLTIAEKFALQKGKVIAKEIHYIAKIEKVLIELVHLVNVFDKDTISVVRIAQKPLLRNMRGINRGLGIINKSEVSDLINYIDYLEETKLLESHPEFQTEISYESLGGLKLGNFTKRHPSRSDDKLYWINYIKASNNDLAIKFTYSKVYELKKILEGLLPQMRTTSYFLVD